jgi:Asp-tRNA(Asn)/Glu-tRNA(Gln) amidotransferase A subunit family amidase
MEATRLEWLSATDAARAIAEGAVSSEQLVEACLARIRAAEPEVQAWQFLDPQHALSRRARATQTARKAGPADRCGVPVGIRTSSTRPTCNRGRHGAARAHAAACAMRRW